MSRVYAQDGNTHWITDCITEGMLIFPFSLPHAPLALAVWRVDWALTKPGHAPGDPSGKMTPTDGRYIIQLTSADGGPANLQNLGQIDSDLNPWQNPAVWLYQRGLDVTAMMNWLIGQNKWTEVGTIVAGDGRNQMTMMTSRLELTWAVG